MKIENPPFQMPGFNFFDSFGFLIEIKQFWKSVCWDCNIECHVPMAVLMTYA